MSREYVELVRRGYAAYAEIGIEGVIPFYAEDLVIYSIPEWPDDPEYHGHDGLRRLGRQWTENFDDFGFHLHEVRDAGDSVVANFEMTGRIKGSAVPISQPIGSVSSNFSDGQIGQVRYFSSWSRALEAAGLRA